MLKPRHYWTKEEIDQLIHLREVKRLKWREISKIMGHPPANLTWAFYYYGGERPPPAVKKPRPAPKPKASRLKASKPVDRIVGAPTRAEAARLAAPVVRPRYFHEADMDIIARIDRQGLTAGFLGDPPAGRSALDRRTS